MSGPPLRYRTFVFYAVIFHIASLVPRKTSYGVSWWEVAGGVLGMVPRIGRVGVGADGGRASVGKVNCGEGEADDMVGRELG